MSQTQFQTQALVQGEFDSDKIIKLKPIATPTDLPFHILKCIYEDEGRIEYEFVKSPGEKLTLKEALQAMQDENQNDTFVAAWHAPLNSRPKFVWLFQEDVEMYSGSHYSSLILRKGLVKLMYGEFTLLA